MSRRISQREARRLRKRVDELERAIERQRAVYSQEYFAGTEICREQLVSTNAMAVKTARRLRHAVVVVGDDTDTVRFIALPQPKAFA